MSSRYANNIGTALENPTMVKELYVNLNYEQERNLLSRISELLNLSKLTFSNGAEFEFPKEIFKLKKLKELYFSSTQFESFPDELGLLSSLESLTFYTVPLKKLPESISDLSHLKRIIIEGAKLEELPRTFGLLKNLEFVSIKNTPLSVLPDNIGGLKKLKELKLGNNKLTQLPTSFGDLESLEKLELHNNSFEAFPQALCRLKKLQIFYLSNNSITALPEEIGGMQNLTFLSLDCNKFRDFPEQIYQLARLNSLYLGDNQISSLPDSLGKDAKYLDTLVLSGNTFEHFPYILFDWYKLKKSQRWRLSIDRKYYNNTEIFDLLESKTFQDSAWQSQIDFFHIFIDDKSAMAQIPLPRLWEALNTAVPKIAAMTLAFMTEPMKTPLQKGDKIFIAGKLTQDVEMLKTRLQDYEIELVSKLEVNTKHILVTARSNKKIFKTWSENAHWQWITEAQLMQFFDIVNPSYLVESANTDAQKVSDLIMTLDEDNMALAMTLVEGGGLPESLFTELFIVYKFSKQEELCKKALELLKQKANPELQNVLKNRSQVYKKSYFRDRDRRDLEEHLILFTDDSGLDIGKLAYVFYKKAGCCLSAVLDYAPAELKVNVLSSIIGTYATFRLMYDTWLENFPLELFVFPNLKSIAINAYKEKKVKGVWVENTNFFIPEDIHRFQDLEEFQISGMSFSALPLESFAKMKKLKRIFVNVTADFDKEAAIGMLPHCEIFFR